MAQVGGGGYLGPGVMSQGAGDIGTSSGQSLSFRYFAAATAVYDNGIQPFAVDSKGNLITLNGLYGVQLDFGALGVHDWAHAVLGLNYQGDLYHYENDSALDGTSQNLSLGVSYQKSRRLAFDFREVGGISSLAFGTPGYYGTSSVPTALVNQPTSLLFDNRIYYTDSSMNVNFILSPRTIVTVGGDGFLVDRQASGLAGTKGYSLRGSIQHRLTRTRTVGFTYERLHFEFPPAFGQSDSNLGELFFANALGKRWTISVSAGVFQTEASGVQQISLNPVIAALLGQSYGLQAFYSENIFPSGSASLTGKFKNSTATVSYSRTVVPGNGIYLTSRQESAAVSYSYTGIRKWNFGVGGGYNTLAGIGENIQPYSSYTAGAGVTYTIARALRAVARYDAHHQEIMIVGYRNTGYRATVGLAYSPGARPLSLW